MDVESPGGGYGGGTPPDSPRDGLLGIELKKHRMTTGKDSEDFSNRYQLLEQLGSGASGTVWKCQLAPGQSGRKPPAAGADGPEPGVIYAAKIIDLRPFKLRERFNMQRLVREVDIMRRLRHPNIIGLLEALDTPEQLVLVLEYAPGVELFDAILSKSRFTEDEARPVFVQVARALKYMHSMQIVHRDVKPENVMIIDRPTKDGLYPEAKLLDFGLSKAIDIDGGGSVARTFVGTPSYLAPEVEEKAGGRGKPYGTPVDCWSLGAMLYVMLVARFPEFQLQGKRKYVRMQGPLWNEVSPEAKELIARLMAFDPGARLTVNKALRHPWLRELATKQPPPPPLQQQQQQQQKPPSGRMLPPQNMSFSVPPAALAAETLGLTKPGVIPAAVGGKGGVTLSIPDSEPSQKRGRVPSSSSSCSSTSTSTTSSSSSSSSKPSLPIVTEQQTPPATSARKSFQFTPPGPKIRELRSDESPLPSLDAGTGGQLTNTGNTNTSTSALNGGLGSSFGGGGGGGGFGSGGGFGGGVMMMNDEARVRESSTMAVYGAQEMGLVGPPEAGVPLLKLQNRITACLETAVTTYSESPEAAASLRRSAILCRESLRESVTLLRKIERTAAQVITLFPDLTLAVEEGEPELAHDFFATVKGWVREMYSAVSLVQAHNSANAKEVGTAMKDHALMGLESRRRLEEDSRKEQQDQQRQQDQKQQHEQQQKQQAQQQQGSEGGRGYVSVRMQESPDGNVRNGAAAPSQQRSGSLITVDPDTFEVIRQIQALNNAEGGSLGSVKGDSLLSSSSSSTSASASVKSENVPINNAAGGGAAAATAAAGGAGAGSGGGGGVGDGRNKAGDSSTSAAVAAGARSMVESLSDEKLMNLFLLMAEVSNSTGVSHSDDEGEMGAATVEAAATRVPATSGNVGVTVGIVDDDTTMSGLTAQMSLDEGTSSAGALVNEISPYSETVTPLAATGVSATNGNSRTDITVDAVGSGGVSNISEGGEQQEDGEEAWSGMQLARRHEDKVFAEVQRALQMLHEVDSVLEQLALFWANSEVIFDVLLRKGDLVEKFVAFANKPRLLQRFRERLADYKRFWQGVQGVCNKYVCGQVECTGTPAGVVPPSSATTAGGTIFEHQASSNDGSVAGGPGVARNNSNSSSSSGMGMEGGDGFVGTPVKEGLGGAGSWSTVEMGMDADKIH